MFDGLLTEKPQIDLLVDLVEASRNVPRDKRQKFLILTGDDTTTVFHPGLPDGSLVVYAGDIEALGNARLLNVSYDLRFYTQEPTGFDVAPLGFQYYGYLKQISGESVQRVQSEVIAYLNKELFEKRYPLAFIKWRGAEALLWDADPQAQLTSIGHLCREAMQEFVTSLVEIHQPTGVDENKAHTVSRFKSVLSSNSPNLGSTVVPFLDALITYCNTFAKIWLVSGLSSGSFGDSILQAQNQLNCLRQNPHAVLIRAVCLCLTTSTPDNWRRYCLLGNS